MWGTIVVVALVQGRRPTPFPSQPAAQVLPEWAPSRFPPANDALEERMSNWAVALGALSALFETYCVLLIRSRERRRAAQAHGL